MFTHEIPTHLEVEDTLVFGLTARQTLALGLGLCLGYVCYQHTRLGLPGLGTWLVPLPFRLGVALIPAILGAVVAFVRPLGRPLEQWLLVWVRYQGLPKHLVWQSGQERSYWTDDEVDAVAADLTRASAPPAAAPQHSRLAGVLAATYKEMVHG